MTAAKNTGRPQDPTEAIVYDALINAKIPFGIGQDEGALDFHLLGTDTFIECKAYYTLRVNRQLEANQNVILIQGKHAAEVFADMLAGRMKRDD